VYFRCLTFVPRPKKTINTISETPTKAIGYIRVSTAQQADHGSSLEAQEERLRSYATLRGLELVRIEVDAGASASTLERPALQRALASLEAGEATALLVVKLDRLTRSVRDFCALVDTCFKDGKHTLMSVNENIDTSNAMGRMVLNILMSVSQWEREAAAERTAAVKQHLKSAGKFGGGWPPYGYALDEDGNLIENVEELAILIEAKSLHAQGKSLRGIASHLPSNPRTGKPFAASQITRML
jgi:site-specific DNA recombinase